MNNTDNRHGLDLLMQAQALWQARAAFRADRLRNKRYTYGRQWDDVIEVEGQTMTEAQYIRQQGSLPLKNNLIRRLVRSVLGVWHLRARRPAVHAAHDRDALKAVELQRLMHANARLNRLDEIYARTMEEFLISGFAVHRKWFGCRNGAMGCWTDMVDAEAFFMDTASRDCRGWDIDAIGQLHDLSMEKLLSIFGDDDESRERLQRLYAGCGTPEWVHMLHEGADKDFLSPSVPGLCRVVEIWRRTPDNYFVVHDPMRGECRRVDEKDRRRLVTDENRRRLQHGLPLLEVRRVNGWKWNWHYLAPTGHILASGPSPYRSHGHPYVFKAYPFIDGEIHSFVADVIDQQRYANRLITLYDWVIRSSAKGVLLFPEDALPDGVDLRDVADNWARFNGVIGYCPQPGQPMPQQVTGNAANLGITELLGIQMKLLEDVSGVNAALQGRTDSGTVSGSLFSQQTQNALTALLDILESFDAFILDASARDAANLCDFRSHALQGFEYDLHLVQTTSENPDLKTETHDAQRIQ